MKFREVISKASEDLLDVSLGLAVGFWIVLGSGKVLEIKQDAYCGILWCVFHMHRFYEGILIHFMLREVVSKTSEDFLVVSSNFAVDFWTVISCGEVLETKQDA